MIEMNRIKKILGMYGYTLVFNSKYHSSETDYVNQVITLTSGSNSVLLADLYHEIGHSVSPCTWNDALSEVACEALSIHMQYPHATYAYAVLEAMSWFKEYRSEYRKEPLYDSSIGKVVKYSSALAALKYLLRQPLVIEIKGGVV
jgi:hypothetical protein